LRESPLTQIDVITDAIVRYLHPWFDLPFVFFGHSMGALVAFEVQRQLRRANGVLAKHLFVSGRRAPHLKSRKRDLHKLPDPEFKRELLLFNGTPEQVLRDYELMQLLLPMLRADFRVCETHIYSPEEPGPAPISAFGGINDPEASREELEGWSKHTTSTMSLRMFPGDHFFLHAMRSRLISAILDDLCPYLYGAGERLNTTARVLA
jgi:medium-chain acyl-[acyl-carrier-protein] hydrolase